MDERSYPDRGYTLVELLAAVAVMSIAFAGVFGAIIMFYRGEGVQRGRAQMDTALRSYAEQVLALPYVDCANPSNKYRDVTMPKDGSGADYSRSIVITYWNGDMPATFRTQCGNNGDLGLQQITITLTDSAGVVDSLVIGKSR